MFHMRMLLTVVHLLLALFFAHELLRFLLPFLSLASPSALLPILPSLMTRVLACVCTWRLLHKIFLQTLRV